MMQYTLLSQDGAARRGYITFPNGQIVQTPVFMPVGTLGTVKGLSVEELHSIGAEIILGNTFHLMLRPGEHIVQAHGGLHKKKIQGERTRIEAYLQFSEIPEE